MMKNNQTGDARGGVTPPHLKVLTAIRTWAHGDVNLTVINFMIFHEIDSETY